LVREPCCCSRPSAHQESPGRYYQDRVYGETTTAARSVCICRAFPSKNWGLPELGPESVPSKTLRWQKRIYQYFALPAVLYVGLVQVIRKSLKGHEQEAHEREKETGLRAQL
jgi:hypothetical protein